MAIATEPMLSYERYTIYTCIQGGPNHLPRVGVLVDLRLDHRGRPAGLLRRAGSGIGVLHHLVDGDGEILLALRRPVRRTVRGMVARIHLSLVDLIDLDLVGIEGQAPGDRVHGREGVLVA